MIVVMFAAAAICGAIKGYELGMWTALIIGTIIAIARDGQ
jgi:hypothetical protein